MHAWRRFASRRAAAAASFRPPTALLSSLFGRRMPDALEKLKQEVPKPPR
jgi:hypothetical protein